MVVLLRNCNASEHENWRTIVNEKASQIHVNGIKVSIINECLICGKINLQANIYDEHVERLRDTLPNHVEIAIEHFKKHGYRFYTDEECKQLMVFYW